MKAQIFIFSSTLENIALKNMQRIHIQVNTDAKALIKCIFTHTHTHTFAIPLLIKGHTRMVSAVDLSVAVGAEWRRPSLTPAAAWGSCGSCWLHTLHSSTSAHKGLAELQNSCSHGGKDEEVEEEV